MKRQLSDSDEKLPHKLLTKDKTSTSHSFYPTNEYCVYWLDEFHSNLLKHYNIDKSRLRGIIDYIQTFDKLDQCERAMRQNNENKVFIVVNASICVKLLTLFHDSEQVHSIYTYKDDGSIDQLLIDECIDLFCTTYIIFRKRWIDCAYRRRNTSNVEMFIIDE